MSEPERNTESKRSTRPEGVPDLRRPITRLRFWARLFDAIELWAFRGYSLEDVERLSEVLAKRYCENPLPTKDELMARVRPWYVEITSAFIVESRETRPCARCGIEDPAAFRERNRRLNAERGEHQ